MSVNRTWKLYEILGLNKDNSPSEGEIKKAYRKMALKYHPDKNGDAEWAKEKFQEIGNAYETLSDPAKKREYDLYGDKRDDDNNSYNSYGNYSYSSYNWDNWYENWKKENDAWWDEFWKDQEKQSKERKEKWDRKDKERDAKYLKERQDDAIDYLVKELLRKNVPAQKLNAQLGVSDWRIKITEITDKWKVHDKKWHISDMIDLLSREFTCDACGKTRNDLCFPYKSGGKTFCDWDCKETYNKKNGENESVPTPDKKDFSPFEEEKEICEKCYKKFPYSEKRLGESLCSSCQKLKDAGEIKDEIRKLREFFEQKANKKDDEKIEKKGRVHHTVIKENPLQQLLDWMKKEGVVAFSFKDNKLIIELDGRKTKILENNNLTSEQEELKNYFQQNPTVKQSISRNELESEIRGAQGNSEVDPKKDNNGWIAPVGIGLGVIVLFLVGVIVYKNKKKKNY